MQNFNFQNKTLANTNFNFPQMANTLTGWEIPLTFIKIVQGTNDGDLTITEKPIKFMGVWQPLRMENLLSKPEGQRSWSWYWVHAKSGTIDLQTADKFLYANKRYKVMSVKDYSLNGFIEYEVIEDFE